MDLDRAADGEQTQPSDILAAFAKAAMVSAAAQDEQTQLLRASLSREPTSSAQATTAPTVGIPAVTRKLKKEPAAAAARST